jgi:hypothetical protein
MFVIYNAILRRYPADIYDVFKDVNAFPTTIFVLVSAVQKLSRCMNIPPGTLLFRGLGGSMELPDTFFVPSDKCTTPNALGYCEFGFMSTTQDRSVAVQYSGVRDNKPKASIMEIHPNSVDRGADISEFSQYPGEKEFLIVPYSFVQGQGRQRTEITEGGGVLTVISATVNINIKTETVEELTGKKKNMHLSAFHSLIRETAGQIHETLNRSSERFHKEEFEGGGHDRGRDITYSVAFLKEGVDFDAKEVEYFDDVSKIFECNLFMCERMGEIEVKAIRAFERLSVESLNAIMSKHKELPDSDYTDDLKYSAIVTQMLSVQAWAKHKIDYFDHTHGFELFYPQQKSLLLQKEFSEMSLEEAHANWLRRCDNSVCPLSLGSLFCVACAQMQKK